jgi:hypothetical protein
LQVGHQLRQPAFSRCIWLEVGIATSQQKPALPTLGVLDRLVNGRGDARGLKACDSLGPGAARLRCGVEETIEGDGDQKGEGYCRKQQCWQEPRS